MNSTTNIEWTNHTINFWWGCTKVSPACTHCYAEEMGRRFGPRLFGQPVLWGAGKPRFERLEAARKETLKIQKDFEKRRLGDSEIQRPRVFVNSMSDWLDEEVPLEWLAFLLETIHLCPNLDFQLLTKRPENWGARMFEVETLAISTLQPMLAKWMTGFAPAHIWIGTTVENQRYADERIPHLLKIPAKVRFLSMEPLSGPVDLTRIDDGKVFARDVLGIGIHWIIAGGESGGKAEPSHPDWFRSLRDQCREAEVPFFFKQWGEWLPDTETVFLAPDALLQRSYKGQKLDDGTLMLRVGTKLAGHLLDGQEWRQFPR